MSPFRQFAFSLALACLGFASCSVIAGTDNSENNKRIEFGKAYSSAKPEERRAALDILRGCTEKASLGIIITVARLDKEKEVRLAAVQAACAWNDTDGSLASMVVPIVADEKDRETKRQMVQCFPKLPLKHDAIVETMRLLCSLSYPEFSGNNDDNNRNPVDNGKAGGGGGGGGGSVGTGRASQEAVNKQKAYFDDILAVFNTLAGQHIAASNNTRGEVKKWWSTHEADIVKADQDTLAKLRGANVPAKKDSKVPAIP
jgi:hypothetical protein